MNESCDSGGKEETRPPVTPPELHIPAGVIDRHEASEAKKYGLAKWALLVQVITLIAIVVYAGITYKMWRQMILQSNALYQSLKETKVSNERAQRAWVAPLSGVSMKLAGAKHNQNAALYLKNSGHTTASKILVFAQSRVFKEMPKPGSLTYRDGTLRGVIAPGQAIAAPVFVKEWGGAGQERAGGEESNIWSSVWVFVIWGRITYIDAFHDSTVKNDRWTNFCLYFDPHVFRGENLTDFVTCPHSNDAG